MTYIEELMHFFNEKGHLHVTRNGHLPERESTTGIGPLKVRQPRVNDRRVDEDRKRLRFTSTILPPYRKYLLIPMTASVASQARDQSSTLGCKVTLPERKCSAKRILMVWRRSRCWCL